uniref:Uncharacterized protein n=1 Tax=Strongyloides stercoralis TaxID=6248 RepID=A0A0K0E1V3_STRER
MKQILCLVFILLLASIFINGAPNKLIEIACQRNPSLSMCYRGARMRDDPFPRKYHDKHGHIAQPRFFGRLLNDQPIYNDKSVMETFSNFAPATKISVKDLPEEVIKTCTPDCTALHCTNECKCAHTHSVVHRICNPPASAHIANHCQSWYSKCPMFHPIQY